eukprot:131013_1
MFSPSIQKNLSNSSNIRIFHKAWNNNICSMQSFQFHTYNNRNRNNKIIWNNNLLSINSIYQFQYSHFATVMTTKQRQQEMIKRQKELQDQHYETQKAQASTPQYQAVFPGDLSDEEDEYIPEVDWDHTRFESHYKRIWEPEAEPETFREKMYDKILTFFIFGTWIIGAGAFCFGVFAWFKMKRQLKYVRKTQRS